MPKASSNPTQRKRRDRDAPRPAARSSAREGIERVLAVGVVAFAIIAVLGFAGTLLHVAFRDGVPFFAATAWQYAFWLPLVALPLMIVCVIALVVLHGSAKARGR